MAILPSGVPKTRLKQNNTPKTGVLFVVVDVVERAVTTFLEFYVCFCNLRCLLQYANHLESASGFVKNNNVFAVVPA